MSLPYYHVLTPKSSSYEDLSSLLSLEINIRHPVVINLMNLEFNEQREFIGLIENYFASENLDYNFPYPVFILTHHESSLSNISLVKDTSELPLFYKKKEGKMNVKESHLLSKNKLLQQEIYNSDSQRSYEILKEYGQMHARIQELETERVLLKNLMAKALKGKNG